MVMRIALVEAAYPTLGADYVVHKQLVDSAVERNDIEVLSISNPGLRDDDSKGIQRRFVALSAPGANRIERQLKLGRLLPGAVREASKIIEDFQPDVIYSSQQRRDNLLATILAQRAGTPRIVHLHYPYGPWIGRLAAATVKRADHVIAVSEFIRESTLLRGLKDEQVSTVHFPATPMEDFSDRAETRERLGLAPDTRVVLTVGRLDPNKGVQWVLRVLPKIIPDVPDLRVLICGNSVHFPGFEDELRALCTSLDLDDHVSFLGHRGDVPAIMRASDVFCLPTEMDAYPLVFPEAMRAGLPIVAARSGGVPEAVADGVNGLLSLPRDLDALEANLRRVLLDRELAEAMGKASHARLRENFDPATTSDRWCSIIEGVVSQRA